MTIRFYCLILLVTGFLTLPAAAQNKTTKSKTAKADAAYDVGNYYRANELYKKKYAKAKKDPLKAEIAFHLGQSYSKTNNYEEALNWYEKSVNDGNKNPEATWKYAKALANNGRYDDAIVQYTEYKAMAPDDPNTAGEIENCNQAKEWKENPTRAVIENLGALNTKYYDFAPVKSNATNGLFITSSRMESTGNSTDGWYGEKFFDLFSAAQDNNGKWSTPVAVESPVNSSSSDGVPYYHEKTRTLFFTRCNKLKGKEGNCRLMMARWDGSKWSEPEFLPFTSEDFTSGHPVLSADGTTLYFASDMPGTLGGKDIFKVSWNAADSSWGTPANLGYAVNTPKDEMFPYLAEGGKLYFTSNGHAGMGGLDIFSSVNEGGSWSEATNLQYPMNTSADDFGIIFTTDKDGFLSSNRSGGLGMDDIYSFHIPVPVFTVSGRVYDTDTKESIAGATVELFGSDGTALSVKTGGDGMYRYDLKAETKYKISASYTGYLTKFLEVTTVGLEDSKDFVGDFDFPLKSTAKPIELREIYYDLDKATLRAESKKELDALITILNENPTITIKLVAHTDTRASDAYNQDLSDRRAKSVVDYLIDKGIAAERLSSEGRGERENIVSDAEIAKMASTAEKEAAHQKNRRTEFSVLSTDYVPKR
jgi:peptidoglycan-associated lipoprotein